MIRFSFLPFCHRNWIYVFFFIFLPYLEVSPEQPLWNFETEVVVLVSVYPLCKGYRKVSFSHGVFENLVLIVLLQFIYSYVSVYNSYSLCPLKYQLLCVVWYFKEKYSTILMRNDCLSWFVTDVAYFALLIILVIQQNVPPASTPIEVSQQR